MTSELKCPVCNHELYQTASECLTYCCLNKDCPSDSKFAGSKEIWQAMIQSQKDLEIVQQALDIANKAIECSERFLLGVQDKKIEMAKATRSSHLLLFQMPAMAALCLNTIRDYKDQIKTITEHKE